MHTNKILRILFTGLLLYLLSSNRSSHLEVFCRKGVPEACNFIKKETLAQVFSSELYEISKNTFFYRTSPVATSGVSKKEPPIRFY